MTKKQIEAEAAFAKAVYKDRAKINRRALSMLTGTRPVTIRLSNRDIEYAKQQAEEKRLKYQTYIEILLHQALSRKANRMPRSVFNQSIRHQ